MRHGDADSQKLGMDQAIGALDSLDRALARGEEVFGTMEKFRISLLDLRAHMGAEWKTFATEAFHGHAVRARVHESPFSRRSYEQPRGYPGDAVTLDYIYGLIPVDGVSALGKAVFDWEHQTQSCRSVRSRRELLAKTIDEAAAARSGPRMASVACGHLREAELSEALGAGAVSEFQALDQDDESLECVRSRWGGTPVRAVSGSVRSILAGKTELRDMDLVYSAGLYDYLAEPVATRLTTRMFEMLRPGGRLLVANFHPDLPDIGGMETMMRWWLTYRDEDQVGALGREIPEEQVSKRRVFRDAAGNIAYLEIERG